MEVKVETTPVGDAGNIKIGDGSEVNMSNAALPDDVNRETIEQLSERMVKTIVEAAGRRVAGIVESAGANVTHLLDLQMASISQSTASIVSSTQEQTQIEDKKRALAATLGTQGPMTITVVDKRSGEIAAVKLPAPVEGETLSGYKITIG